jgi:hypothetical protein
LIPSSNNLHIVTSFFQVYMGLQPAREDGGCVLCEQIYDDPDNQIVLCDHCDRGFHQLCYSPTIDSKFAEVLDKEWLCHACTMPLSTTSSQGLSAMTEDMSLTGLQVSQEVKENYLRSMTKSNLVKLISRIETAAPNIKLYPSRLSSPTALQSDEIRFMSSTPIDVLMTPSRRESASQDMYDGLGDQISTDAQMSYYSRLRLILNIECVLCSSDIEISNINIIFFRFRFCRFAFPTSPRGHRNQ